MFKTLFDEAWIVAIIAAGVLFWISLINAKNAQEDLQQEVALVQTRTAPVVENMVATHKWSTPAHLDLRVIGSKVRDCGPPIASTANYGANTFESFIFLDDLTEEGIRVPDAQDLGDLVDFGVWRFTPNSQDTPIFVRIFHDCEGITVHSDFTLYPDKAKEG